MKYLLACLICVASTAGLSAQIITFDLIGQGGTGLLGGNETGSVSGTPGVGGEISSGISLDQGTGILTINVGWGTGNGFSTDLTGVASSAHIHGPAGQTSTGAVLLSLNGNGYSFTGAADNGMITGSANISLIGSEADLLAGNWYINVHTAANPGGEIRGNLVQTSPVPEPSTYAFLAGLGALGLVATRRRRA